MATHFVISLGILAAALYSVLGEGAKEAETEHLMKEIRKEHSNERYQSPPGTRLVEIDFAEELAEGDMRTLQVGEAQDQKVLVARY